MQYTNLRTDVVVEAESGESSSSQACTSGDFAAAVEVFWAPVPNLKAEGGRRRGPTEAVLRPPPAELKSMDAGHALHGSASHPPRPSQIQRDQAYMGRRPLTFPVEASQMRRRCNPNSDDPASVHEVQGAEREAIYRAMHTTGCPRWESKE